MTREPTGQEQYLGIGMCSARVDDPTGFGRHGCGKQAKFIENKKLYCTIHAPSYRRAKQLARSRTWEDALAARQAAQKQEQERDHRADCFPELLALLKQAAPYIKTVSRNGAGGYDENDPQLYEEMTAAIIWAEETTR